MQAVEDALALIGSAAAGLCAVLGPSVVVLGGAMIDALGPPAAHLAERSANRDAFPPGRRLSVRLSALGEDAGLIGSALYAAESPAGQPPQAGGPSPPRPPHAGPAVP
ncbi:MAG: hypothetical protein KatS3mg103_1214 [Phycisphaerales bacterium]|nr:MAG: hypothetical protein KatS3mg103_1214 [Phycisphaerales bacterium]